MSSEPKRIPPGLHLVSTPIGAARDITLRALDILAGADVLAAEDTRSLRHLMAIHGLALNGRPLLSLHEHNWEAVRGRLLGALAEGKSVAYASEAGTPLVADPGYQLARDAIAAEAPVLAAPGPSALLAALVVSGLPSDRFLFAGFLPATRTARRKALRELKDVPATAIIYESPKRIREMLEDGVLELGGERRVALCRELTKKFETVLRGTLAEVALIMKEEKAQGEYVVVLDRAQQTELEEGALEAALTEALARASVRDAAREVADRLGLPRREVYQRAMAMKGEG